MFLAAAPLAAATVTRDPAAVSVVVAAETAPWLLVSPLAGVWVDRWPRRTTMIVSDVVRGLALAALALLVALGAASIPALSACAFLIVTGLVFHSAALEATVADLADRDPETLNATNSHLQAGNMFGRQLVGPPAGSAGFALAPWLPFVGHAATLAASAALTAATPATPRPPRTNESVWASLRDGIRWLARHRQLRALAALTAVANAAWNAATATLVLYATDPAGLGMAPAGYGLLLATMAVGGLTGAMVAPRLLRLLPTGRALGVALVSHAVGFGLLAAATNPLLGGFGLALCWAGVSVAGVVISGARQRHTPAEMLGRVISTFRLAGNGAGPLGALIGGALAVVSLRAPILLAVAVYAAAAVAVLAATRRGR